MTPPSRPKCSGRMCEREAEYRVQLKRFHAKPVLMCAECANRADDIGEAEKAVRVMP